MYLFDRYQMEAFAMKDGCTAARCSQEVVSDKAFIATRASKDLVRR
jgi:hypothetical protein